MMLSFKWDKVKKVSYSLNKKNQPRISTFIPSEPKIHSDLRILHLTIVTPSTKTSQKPLNKSTEKKGLRVFWLQEIFTQRVISSATQITLIRTKDKQTGSQIKIMDISWQSKTQPVLLSQTVSRAMTPSYRTLIQTQSKQAFCRLTKSTMKTITKI